MQFFRGVDVLASMRFPLLFAALCSAASIKAQQVTGIWKGKINRTNVEVKIVQKGDSLTGTSYYSEAGSHYRRYSIKGYFDAQTNSVVWWDDQLLRGNAGNPQISIADFNCPGGGVMRLEGTAAPKDDRDHPDGTVHLSKAGGPSFPDEWDYVIDNYTVGANDPDVIDSVALIAFHAAPEPMPEPKPAVVLHPAPPVAAPAKSAPINPMPVPALTIEQKFTNRNKTFTKEIPLSGDSLELRFYDNAEIDGDSISVFLNGQLLCTHVRLSDKPYTIKLPVADMRNSNELVMVAENLGAIPPNTSYMVAIAGDKRYDAQLASTENSSAMIRFVKN